MQWNINETQEASLWKFTESWYYLKTKDVLPLKPRIICLSFVLISNHVYSHLKESQISGQNLTYATARNSGQGNGVKLMWNAPHMWAKFLKLMTKKLFITVCEFQQCWNDKWESPKLTATLPSLANICKSFPRFIFASISIIISNPLPSVAA